MTDTIYTEGFPDGWHMTHRPDTTLLCRKGDFVVGGSRAICAAPRLQQGKEWLETAKALAEGYEGIIKQNLDDKMASFCDRCGYGASCDRGEERDNTRHLKTWQCLDCDHINPRGKPAPAPQTVQEAARVRDLNDLLMRHMPLKQMTIDAIDTGLRAAEIVEGVKLMHGDYLALVDAATSHLRDLSDTPDTAEDGA